MEERRRAPRVHEEIEVTITIGDDGKFPEENVLHKHHCKDISSSGIKINTHIFLPINILLKMDIKLKYLQQKITAMGKVKWIKIIVEDKSYNMGVQFVSTPREATTKLMEYISWKLENENY
ncbi:MAG: PilZ domain-containing protein [Smithella sp.]